MTCAPVLIDAPSAVRPPHNPPLERTAAAVYFTCGRASRVRRRGRSTASRYATQMSGPLDDILEAIFRPIIEPVVDGVVDRAPTWVLGMAFVLATALTVYIFMAVHWSLGIVGAVASLCLGALWLVKLRFG